MTPSPARGQAHAVAAAAAREWHDSTAPTAAARQTKLVCDVRRRTGDLTRCSAINPAGIGMDALSSSGRRGAARGASASGLRSQHSGGADSTCTDREPSCSASSLARFFFFWFGFPWGTDLGMPGCGDLRWQFFHGTNSITARGAAIST